MTFRRRLYLTLSPDERGGIIERVFEGIVILTIIASILEIVLDSVPNIHNEYATPLSHFEIYSLIFFTVEYIARVYSIVEERKYKDPVKGRLKYMGTPLAIVDLCLFI
jgi:voltage-gated potassium channel